MTRMTQEEHELFDDFLGQAFGLSFPEHKRSMLEARLRQRLAALKLKTFFDYYIRLQYDNNGELRSLAQAITNNETYFFRETAQFEAFFEHALPDLKQAHANDPVLRILSAGCSSGEEPYTLNILAKENRYRMWGYEFNIDAFDLDETRIELATAARYGAASFRGLSDEQVDRHFVVLNDGSHEVKARYRSGVEFRVGNILSPGSYCRAYKFDAVFCRNVLIYFSEATLRKAIDNFAAALRPGGFLFLGHSESIIGVSPRFRPVRLGDHVAYQMVDV